LLPLIAVYVTFQALPWCVSEKWVHLLSRSHQINLITCCWANVVISFLWAVFQVLIVNIQPVCEQPEALCCTGYLCISAG